MQLLALCQQRLGLISWVSVNLNDEHAVSARHGETHLHMFACYLPAVAEDILVSYSRPIGQARFPGVSLVMVNITDQLHALNYFVAKQIHPVAR